MAKSKEFRELQISSGQLAAVIFALLALCVFIFYLGTRIGAKKALFAAGGPAEARTEKVIEPKPAVSDPAKPSPHCGDETMFCPTISSSSPCLSWHID